MAPGLVSFVSLGPGDPALLTARAAARLASADVVLQDGEGTAREAIEMASAGKRVVWKVAGDAFEVAHVVEHARALAAAGVAFEVVPGVGARAAAAAFAGLVGGATKVPVGAVAAAVEERAPDVVVTLVARVGEAAQAVVVTRAGEAAEVARGLGVDEVIVATGAPDEALRWFERRPLFGKRVLVTRAVDQARSTAALLTEEGAEAVVVPTIRIEAPSDAEPLARAIEDLRRGAYAWVAFTSANGVERTWTAILAAGRDARVFGAAGLAAVGPATARALEQHGLRADVVAKEFRGEGLAEELLAALAGKPCRVLLARAARARDVLPDALRAAGCTVDVVAAYETRPAPPEAMRAIAAELEAGRLDAVAFTSSSTVEHLCDALGPPAASLLGRIRVASIGPVTSATARDRGVRVDVEAAEYTVPGLIRALANSYANPVA